jgi:hypothetical protein
MCVPGLFECGALVVVGTALRRCEALIRITV